MLGSASDADDAVQETMVRAWKSLDRFEARASMKTWLYRIATNVCIDVLGDRTRRVRPMETGDAGSIDDPLETRERTHWLEPIPDARVLPTGGDPSEIALLRESIRLAFVAALQHLPPRQRAALLLTEVLGWSASEVAETLDLTVAAVNSALQRARATLGALDVAAPVDGGRLTAEQSRLLERYVAAFESYDVDGLTALLREDATFSMPPFALWLRGRASVRGWLRGRGAGCRGSRLVAVAASGSPAFAQYRRQEDGTFCAWALIVLELSGESIAGWNAFLDVDALFPRCALPLTLPG